jgi:hypothetical protein
VRTFHLHSCGSTHISAEAGNPNAGEDQTTKARLHKAVSPS